MFFKKKKFWVGHFILKYQILAEPVDNENFSRFKFLKMPIQLEAFKIIMFMCNNEKCQVAKLNICMCSQICLLHTYYWSIIGSRKCSMCSWQVLRSIIGSRPKAKKKRKKKVFHRGKKKAIAIFFIKCFCFLSKTIQWSF